MRVFGTSANERLGGWSIIRANIQGCSTTLLTISPNYCTLYLPHSPLFYFPLSLFSLALILRSHPSSSSATITFPVSFLAIRNRKLTKKTSMRMAATSWKRSLLASSFRPICPLNNRVWIIYRVSSLVLTPPPLPV